MTWKQESDLFYILSVLHPLYKNKYRNDMLKALWASRINLRRILNKAIENEVAGSFVQLLVTEGFSNSLLRIALTRFNRSIYLLKRTLNLILEISNELGKDLLVIKLHNPYPLTFDDVDLLVRREDFRDIVHALETRGMHDVSKQIKLASIKHLQHRKQEISMWKKGFLEIELYSDFSWSRLDSLDVSFCWQNARKVNIFGIECSVPSPEADILILINHAIFKEGKVTLRDFLYINSVLNHKIDIKTLLMEAKKFGWERSFLTLISKLREWYKSPDKILSKKLCFPYMLPLNMICCSILKLLRTASFREKQLHPFTPLGYCLSLSWMMNQRIKKWLI